MDIKAFVGDVVKPVIKNIVFFIVMLSFIQPINAEVWQPSKRVALIIGNSDYKAPSAKLKNPVNDAELMASSLRVIGFDKVILKTNATRKEMLIALREYKDILSSEKNTDAFFYYAGHGIQVERHNYLIPVDMDTDARNIDSVIDEAINLDRVFKSMERQKSGGNYIVLDACRNDPFSNHSRSLGKIERGLALISPPATEDGPGTFIAYSTSEGKIAEDGDGANSLFTKSLSAHIRRPARLNDIFMDVRREVLNQTNRRQTPEDRSTLTQTVFLQNVLQSDIEMPDNTSAIGANYAQIEQIEREREELVRQQAQAKKASEEAEKLRQQALKMKQDAQNEVRKNTFIPGIM